jgi:hypothetical protein
MSWAGIASNQCVSLNNLQDAVNTSVFTLINTIPAGLKQITKAEAAYYVNIDTGYAPYAAKASNQLVVKSDLVAASCNCEYYGFTISSLDIGASYNLTVYADYFTCAGAGAVTATYTFPSSGIYNDVICVYSFAIPTPDPYLYYYDSPLEITKIFASNSSFNLSTQCCGSTTTTTTTIVPPTTTTTTTTAPPPPVYYTYVVRPSNNLGTICTDPSYTVYSSSILLTSGDFIFYDTALTNPVTGFDYVVRASGSPDIYYMNPGTGELTSDTGIDC